jgi:hypothetical protein
MKPMVIGKCKCGGQVMEDDMYKPAIYCIMCGKRDERVHLWQPEGMEREVS